MRKALQLARNVKGNTSPNPPVAALIVRDGRIIGKGVTQPAGGNHAEVEALASVEDENALRGADMFVTLEPCCKMYPGKRTPPCTDAILQKGIRAVYIACRDKHDTVNGEGIATLRRGGVHVKEGILREKAEYFYRDYFKYITRRLPWVIVKYAMSLDGKIATVAGDSKWISSEASRNIVHILRGEADAIIVGKNTYLADNPTLNVRHGRNKGKTPLRVVMTKRFDIPYTGTLFTDPHETLLVGTEREHAEIPPLPAKKRTLALPHTKEGESDLLALLAHLGEEGVVNVIVEGGGETIARFFEQDLVDEVFVFIAMKLFGGKDAPTPLGGKGILSVEDAYRLEHVSMKRVAGDLLVRGTLRSRHGE